MKEGKSYHHVLVSALTTSGSLFDAFGGLQLMPMASAVLTARPTYMYVTVRSGSVTYPLSVRNRLTVRIQLILRNLGLVVGQQKRYAEASHSKSYQKEITLHHLQISNHSQGATY